MEDIQENSQLNETDNSLVGKRIVFSKENLKKINIAIEALDIKSKPKDAINEVVNEAVEFFFKEKILKELIERY